MKLARVEAIAPARKRFALLRGRPAWQQGVFLAVLLAFSFGAGAFTYRAGALTPLTAFTRAISRGNFSALPEPIKQLGADVKNEALMYVNNGLPTLYLDMPFESYQQLLDKRNEALKLGILNTTDGDFVKTEVRLGEGRKLDAKIRLKGDWTDHLETEKWSFRIHLKEDGQILHTRQFSLQSPDTRNYLYEWAFHRNLQDEGLLTTRYHFVNLLINGRPLGVYALEENFAPELIEAQGRRQGVIIRFNEDLMWQNMTTFWSQGVIQEGQMMASNLWGAEINPFQESKIAQDPVLVAEAETAINLLRSYQAGDLPASAVFDVELMGRFFALHDLWSACHGVAWHNLRFYYNPVTGRLEPVAYDAEPFQWCSPTQTIIGEFIQGAIFEDPQIRAVYARELERLTRPGYVDGLKAELSAEIALLQAALKGEFPDVDLGVDWGRLAERSKALSLELQPAEPVRGHFQALNLEAGALESPALLIDLVNLMLLPVQVDRVEVNGVPLALAGGPVDLAPVTSRENEVFTPVRIEVSLAGLPDLKVDAEHPLDVQVVTRLSGLETEYHSPVSGAKMPERVRVGPAPQQPSLAEILSLHPFLSANPANSRSLRVSPGVWNVQGDLILPLGTELFIPAGTVLSFSEGSILYTNGALNLLGQADAPVLLTAQGAGWGGIVVLNAEQPSTWSYAAVEKTAGITRGGWLMTGGINFFQSDISLEQVKLGNNQTEDAINVMHSRFSFHNSEFANTFADAFDSDFSTGEVTDCTFHDIAGDAIDVSGTQAVVRGARMERITDKGISVGEESSVSVQGAVMDTVGIGVASKDLSTTVVMDSQIKNARFSALAAYTKKPVYGPAQIEASGLIILDSVTEAVAQLGSTIVLNGKAVRPVDLDVDRLYSEGILGN